MDWISTPIQSYEYWLGQRIVGHQNARPYSAQTLRQYRTMFAKFVSWMLAQNLHLHEVNTGDLRRFLDSMQGRHSSASAVRTRRIYLAEMRRVMDQLRADGLRSDNPASDLIAEMRAQEPTPRRNTALVGLDMPQRYSLALSRLDADALALEDVRAHAMALLMLRLGLTQKEVQKLTLHHLRDLAQGVLHAPGHRLLKSRSLPLDDLSQHWLEHWLKRRDALRVEPASSHADAAAGDLPPTVARVFVGLRTRRCGAEQPTRRAYNRISERLIRQAALQAIAMSYPNWPRHIVRGPQMLRNICMMDLLRRGRPHHEIVVFMGLHDTQQVVAVEKLIGNFAEPSAPEWREFLAPSEANAPIPPFKQWQGR